MKRNNLLEKKNEVSTIHLSRRDNRPLFHHRLSIASFINRKTFLISPDLSHGKLSRKKNSMRKNSTRIFFAVKDCCINKRERETQKYIGGKNETIQIGHAEWKRSWSFRCFRKSFPSGSSAFKKVPASLIS